MFVCHILHIHAMCKAGAQHTCVKVVHSIKKTCGGP